MNRPDSGSGPPRDLDALLSLRTPSVGSADDAAGESMGGIGSDRGPGREEVAGVGSADAELVEIDVDAVIPNEFQPRHHFDDEALLALTESIRELGVLQPILVRPDGPDCYQLIAGERRWRAARRAGLATIPAIVRVTEDQGSLEQAIVENLHREDLNALEEAAAYQQLVEDFRLTQDQVAVRVGKSRSAVSNTLRLFQLPPAVQRLVAEGRLGAGHARAILGLEDPASQVALAERVVGEDLSVRGVEDAVRASAQGGESSSGGTSKSEGGRGKSASALEVERRLEDRLGTRVEVVESSGNGKLVIRFADRDDLDRIFGLLDR